MICVYCDEPIDDLEHPHAAHERSCPVSITDEDWSCRCDAHAHVRCCPCSTAVAPVPGQIDLLEPAMTTPRVET